MARKKSFKLNKVGDFNKEKVVPTVLKISGTDSKSEIAIVATAMAESPEYSCALSCANLDEYLAKWVRKYTNGFNNRPSQRASNPISTKTDAVVTAIIKSRIESLSDEDLEKIKYGHRLSMSAENIAGSLLEEFLADSLLPYGWHCCWGETLKSIDFCKKDGTLLQVKNSDNSENSSSKTVRDDTTILHWARRKSQSGKTNWAALNTLIGITDENKKLTEEKFSEFVIKTVIANPACLFIETENPWLKQTNLENED